MASKDFSDPAQGGDLSDMAVSGTSIPSDAGTQRVIPSVPRPGQGDEASSATLDQAADNLTDIPRSVTDQAGGADVTTAYGDTLPATVDSKRLFDAPGGMPQQPGSKGHPREEKAGKQKGGDQDVGATDQAEAED